MEQHVKNSIRKLKALGICGIECFFATVVIPCRHESRNNSPQFYSFISCEETALGFLCIKAEQQVLSVEWLPSPDCFGFGWFPVVTPGLTPAPVR